VSMRAPVGAVLGVRWVVAAQTPNVPARTTTVATATKLILRMGLSPLLEFHAARLARLFRARCDGDHKKALWHGAFAVSPGRGVVHIPDNLLGLIAGNIIGSVWTKMPG